MEFYYQLIVNADLKTIYGLEVLTRVNGEIPDSSQDPVIVSCACLLANIFEDKYGEKYKVHVNIYPDSIEKIDWNVVEKVKNTIRIEILEENISRQMLKEILKLRIKKGIHFFLDDFGTKYANFDIVFPAYWRGIKVDSRCVPKSVSRELQKNFFVIAERTSSLFYPAHAFQSFAFHKPERLSRISAVFRKLPSDTEERIKNR